jgi:hypothetical protein
MIPLLRQQKVTGEPTNIREEPAKLEPVRFDGNLPDLMGTCQITIVIEGPVKHQFPN